MQFFFKKIPYIFIFLMLAFNALNGQTEIIGNDPPENFSWGTPKPEEISFRFISLDGISRSFYVQKDTFFAPVQMSGRSLGRLYSTKKGKEIVLYNRLPLADQEVKGKARFVPAITLSVDDSSDVILGIYSAGNSLRGGVIDVSLNAMPLGSFNVVSLNPGKMAFKADKHAFVLSFFQKYKLELGSDRKRLLDIPFASYNVKTNPVSLVESRRISFWSTERMIIFVYAITEPKKSAGSLGGDMGTSFSDKEENSQHHSMLVVTNKGPR